MGAVTKAHITKACRPGGPFVAAITGKHLDAGHPVLVDWLQKRASLQTAPSKSAQKEHKTLTKPRPKSAKKAPLKKVPKRTPKPETEEDLTESLDFAGLEDDKTSRAPAEWAELTLREIVDRFGGQLQALNCLKALNAIEQVRERRLKNETHEGSLISRDLVETHLLGLVEEAHQRLLTDLPKTLARTIRAHAQSNTPLEQSEREIRNVLGKTLDATKSKVTCKLSKV